MKIRDGIVEKVNTYYSEKVKKYGATPKGVDWNSVESQKMRFQICLKVLDDAVNDVSILDYGCGYGSMYEYLNDKLESFRYTGYDISKEMLGAAQKLHHASNTKWVNHLEQGKKFNYTILSGIFNVKLEYSDEEWKDYILNKLEEVNDLSLRGFSFNMLTSYSDKEFMRENLYYGDPLFFFDLCKRMYSPYVTLIHDYPLYEFTILVKK